MVSKTWYDEEKNRWEMDPVAVPYAVSKKLVEHARIRHDWAAMYIALKGDDKEYFIDIKVFLHIPLFLFLSMNYYLYAYNISILISGI